MNRNVANFLVVALLVSLCLCQAESSTTCGLRVLKDGEESTTIYCQEEYDQSACISFIDSFDQSLLPPNLQSDKSVTPPTNLQLTPGMTQATNGYYQSMLISWKSPASGLSKYGLTGFLMIYTSKTTTCKMFRLNNNNRTGETLSFEFLYPRVRPMMQHNVTLYSLPAPGPTESEDPNMLIRQSMTSGMAFDLTPEGYRVAISHYGERTGKLHVTINLAPLQLNFTQYTIKLMKYSHSSVNYFQEVIFTTEVRSEEKTVDTYTFTGLGTDDYSINVQPYDQFRDDRELCKCYTASSTGTKVCGLFCQATLGERFHLDVDPEYEPILSTTPSTSEAQPVSSAGPGPGPTTDFRVSSSDDSINVVTVVVPIVGGVLILLVIGTIYIKRDCRNTVNGKSKQHTNFPPELVTKDPFNGETAQLSTKTVFILATQDHYAHNHLVDCLANFLQVHCQCQVLYPPWQDLHEGSYKLLVNNRKHAHAVLFVGSPVAQCLMDAFMANQSYRSYSSNFPHGDLFTLGAHWLMTQGVEPEVWKSLVPVTFHPGQPWCKEYLMTPSVYSLPSQLAQVLQRIHSLSDTDTRSLDGFLPVHVENLPQIPEGRQLLEAVKLSQQYEQEHPGWLEARLGSPTPRFTTAISSSPSGDSDYGSLILDRPVSVSTQDLTFSDTPGSPISVISGDAGIGFPLHGRQGSTHSLPSTWQKKNGPWADSVCPTVFSEAFPTPAGGDEGFSVCRTLVSGMTSSPETPIWPPESASAIQCDSVSNALAQVNQRADARSTGPWRSISEIHAESGEDIRYEGLSDVQPPASLETVPPDFAYSSHPFSNPSVDPTGTAVQFPRPSIIIPPEEADDILSECLSRGFQDINTHSHDFDIEQEC